MLWTLVSIDELQVGMSSFRVVVLMGVVPFEACQRTKGSLPFEGVHYFQLEWAQWLQWSARLLYSGLAGTVSKAPFHGRPASGPITQCCPSHVLLKTVCLLTFWRAKPSTRRSSVSPPPFPHPRRSISVGMVWGLTLRLRCPLPTWKVACSSASSSWCPVGFLWFPAKGTPPQRRLQRLIPIPFFPGFLLLQTSWSAGCWKERWWKRVQK